MEFNDCYSIVLSLVPGNFRGKIGRGVALTTYPHLAPWLLKEESYALLPPWAFVGCFRANFTLPK